MQIVNPQKRMLDLRVGYSLLYLGYVILYSLVGYITEYGTSALYDAWVKTCTTLAGVTARIQTLGIASIPILSYEEATLPNNEDVRSRMKAAGCFIIGGVIPTEGAAQEFEELQAFIADNKDTVTGWPAKSIAIYHLFTLQRSLNSLWGDLSCSPKELEAEYETILYPDGIRIRAPGQEFLGLGPHIDAGSLSRWADDEYRRTYGSILSGKPEDYDPYDMTHRKSANPGMCPSGPHSSVLRAFQGWTALTPCKPGEGGLMVVPDIKTVTAYMILRPFFKAPEDGDWRDPEKWEIDGENGWFPGTYRWGSQLLSPASHPHLFLEDTLLSVPEMQPGNTVWWHADMCHAVEPTHNGRLPASVCYIPSSPSTPSNLSYIRKHWKDLVAGNPPDDYKYLDGTGSELVLSKQNERKMKGAFPLDALRAERRRGLGEGV
ncbi:hypothetical protein BP5796_07655 [Coleophoma crateriformis]|uniref:DUF1479-domain-containing protein n=1 Tax=Coleophoma crateriformis TaxID=565419 RepID=A0A3D8RJI3_9HELO|nr:hypothetical protein BP5796_07655 [Coleophoma crateriformis]